VQTLANNSWHILTLTANYQLCNSYITSDHHKRSS